MAIQQHDRPHDDDEVARILDEWRAQRPDLDPTPMGVLGRVARVYARQHAGLSALLERHDLTPSSFDVLANLRRSAPPHRKTPSELAVSSLISTGGVTFRLDRLEADGLIRRVRADHDRRISYAELTDAGIALIDRVIEEHLQREHDIVSALADRERDEIARLLAVLERSLNTVDAERRRQRVNGAAFDRSGTAQ